jgi:formylglycine-generating enzyme required for sulfatase activity
MPSDPLSQSQSALDAVPETGSFDQPTPAPASPPGPGDLAALALQPGARPLPDYELVRLLGKGGFGEVWQARGPGGIDVALKFIRLDVRGSELEVRSLDVMKTIRHPNLAGLSGAWRTDPFLILAMELCDRSLKDRLDEARAQKLPGIPAKELLGYLRDAAAGLEALHEHHAQHRDIKPGNLLLLHRGVKVADFGLAKVLEQTVASHTGSMTLAYAAPEFFNGEVTRYSDQYSLAATYFQLRTGQLVFQGSHQQVMYAHLNVPPDLSKLLAAEQTVVARALAKLPAERWPSCEAFVNALAKAYNQDRQEKKAVKKDNQAPVPRAAVVATPKEKQKRELPEPLPKPVLPPAKPGALSPTVTLDLGGDVKMEFAFIDPQAKPDGGQFKMGSPPDEKERNPRETAFDAEKQHDVRITKPFYLAKVPVTQQQYALLAGDNPSYFRKGGKGEERLKDVPDKDASAFPVEMVSWMEAADFCRKMQPFREQMPAVLQQQNYRFALPTEAQWEYACRAGTTAPFSFGSILNGKQANCLGKFPYGTEEKGPYLDRTTKGDTYGANAWGLCDMHGNVWQWCEDYYGPYDENLTKEDPLRKVKHAEERRVLRGGSWSSNASYCRAAFRGWDVPDFRSYMVGFRLCFRLE